MTVSGTTAPTSGTNSAAATTTPSTTTTTPPPESSRGAEAVSTQSTTSFAPADADSADDGADSDLATALADRARETSPEPEPATPTPTVATPTQGATTEASRSADELQALWAPRLADIEQLMARARAVGDSSAVDRLQQQYDEMTAAYAAGETPEEFQVRSGTHDGVLDEEIDELEAHIAELEAQRASGSTGATDAQEGVESLRGNAMTSVQIVVAERELDTARALNFLAETAYRAGFPPEVAQILEGDPSIPIVVGSTNAGYADAEFDLENNRIVVTPEMIAEVLSALDELTIAGITTADGTIRDIARFQAHPHYKGIYDKITVIGVHEPLHAAAHEDGEIVVATDEYTATTDAIEDEQAALEDGPASPEVVGSIISLERQALQAELDYLEAVEYPTYLAQETSQVLGSIDKSVYLTIDEQGNPLPVYQAVMNIYRFTNGMSILYGPSAGMLPDGTYASDGDGDPDGKRVPGKRVPGKRVPGTVVS